MDLFENPLKILVCKNPLNIELFDFEYIKYD